MTLLEIPVASDAFLDIPEAFRPIAQKHGRILFTLVWHSQTAGIATERLAAFATKHRSSHTMYAVEVLGRGFNALAQALVDAKEFSEGQVAECDRDILMVAKAQVIAPPNIVQFDS